MLTFTGMVLALAMPVILRAAEDELLAGVDDKWRRYQSPNFELYSRNSDSKSRELLHNLELLRALFLERLKFVERSRLDVTIYYFRSLADFRAYAAEGFRQNEYFRAFYLPCADRAVISMAPVDSWDGAQRLIFHEYVHHLFRAAGEDPPVWLNEGMAELFATVQNDGVHVEVGRTNPGQLAKLRQEKLVPLETLFAVDHESRIYRSDDHTGLFYAESWALLHYWYFGQSDLPPDAVTRFLHVAGNQKKAEGVDLRSFFRECFGMDYPDMLRRLERYVKDGSYRFNRQPAPEVEPAKNYALRPVLRDEIRVRLADLALRMSRSAIAKFVLLDAITQTPDDPRPFETLGADALLDGDQVAARERWEQALAVGSHNVAIYRELCLLECRTWFQQFDYYFRLPTDAAGRLRGRLMQSIEIEPQQSAAYEMLAWVEAYSNEPSIANINLIQRHFASLLQQQRTLLALALVRVHTNQKDAAKQMLNDLGKLPPDPWAMEAAEIVLAKLEGRPVKRRPTPQSPNRAPVFVPPSLRQNLKLPPIELPEKP